ncbi:MAG: efflux RND transporter periplasmic adaptor subunit [Candidatus Sericytochromatia bacterium]|nr:efflux RND transporter periplasmic adaptor subunit [Candidatus Sericytochromatia bacterium]
MNRTLRWLLPLLGTGGVGFGVWYFGTSHEETTVYSTQPVETGPIQAKVSASGILSAVVTVQVGTQVSGRIQDLLVDYNSSVRKGQVLARLEPQLFEAELARAQANRVAAQSALTRAEIEQQQAKLQLERARQLWDRQLVARADLDNAQANSDAARAQAASARAQVAQSEAQVNQARLNLTFTTIVSPIDGTIISRSVDVGQTVAASLQTPTLFEIAQDLRKAQVAAAISEADVGKLKPGMLASFSVAAYPQERFEGSIRQVRNAPRTEQNVVTYDAIIDVQNPALKLKPGMTANVSIIYAQRDEALRIPNGALRFAPPSHEKGHSPQSASHAGPPAAKAPGKSRSRETLSDPMERRVWRLKNDKPEALVVKTGITDGNFTEVVSGNLTAGDLIILDTKTASSNSKNSHSGGRRARVPRF